MNFRLVSSAALLVLVAGTSAAATAQEKSDDEARPVVALHSVYLVEPIGRAHQIRLEGALGGSGRITLDGNTCVLNQFGDPAICTEIAFPPIDVRLEQLRIADPMGRGRRLFRIDGKLQPPDAQFYLVVPRRRSQPHRLVVDLGQDHRRVVTLEPTPAPRGRPELCKSAEYRAVQADGKVTIFARGEHPTAGWRTLFEQLPIRIFPPQFRLVCISPVDAAAQVITPFEVTTSFASDQPVRQVIVHDAAGQHKVPVGK